MFRKENQTPFYKLNKDTSGELKTIFELVKLKNY